MRFNACFQIHKVDVMVSYKIDEILGVGRQSTERKSKMLETPVLEIVACSITIKNYVFYVTKTIKIICEADTFDPLNMQNQHPQN
jgi:hypothetical protein